LITKYIGHYYHYLCSYYLLALLVCDESAVRNCAGSPDSVLNAGLGEATQGEATQGETTQGEATQGEATQGEATQELTEEVKPCAQSETHQRTC